MNFTIQEILADLREREISELAIDLNGDIAMITTIPSLKEIAAQKIETDQEVPVSEEEVLSMVDELWDRIRFHSKDRE